MRFTQPNSLSRAMHQVLDRLIAHQALSLEFGTDEEMCHALEVLNEVAISRSIGVVVTSTTKHIIELRLSEPQAA